MVTVGESIMTSPSVGSNDVRVSDVMMDDRPCNVTDQSGVVLCTVTSLDLDLSTMISFDNVSASLLLHANEPPCTDRSVIVMVMLSVVLAGIIVLTVGGNLLVCVTIRTNRRLQSPTNCFVFSLATTDLLLGATVLPVSALTTVYSHWPFGVIFCNIYVSADVMLCTVSILTLFAISLDRYFAVQTPLRYEQHASMRLAVRLAAVIWLFSFVMAFVPIHLGWNTPSLRVQNTDNPSLCHFELNRPYALLVAIGTYAAPLIVMCAVYMVVWQTTRRQVRAINRLTRNVSQSSSSANQNARMSICGVIDSGPRSSHHKLSCSEGPYTQLPLNDGRCSITQTNSSVARATTAPRLSLRPWEKRIVGGNDIQNGGGCCTSAGGRKMKPTKSLKDTKATVTLATVVLCFAICWIPYFTLFTFKPFLASPINCHVDLLVLWLGYANSAINPFLYAFYNSHFRAGFYRVLCPHRYQRALRTSIMDEMSWRYTSNVDMTEGVNGTPTVA